MQALEIITLAKRLIKATRHQQLSDSQTILHHLLTHDPVQTWPASALPWVIAGLIHCLDRLPLSSIPPITPSVFELFARLLDNEWSHPIVIEGLKLQGHSPASPKRFLIIPRLVMALNDDAHLPEAFYLAHQLLVLQSQTNQSELFQGLLPIHCDQLQHAISHSHKNPLSHQAIISLELMAHSFPVAFDQLMAPLPRRTKQRIVSQLSVTWPRGWMAESRMPKVAWWQRVGLALF